jgi:chitin synthase
MSTPRRVYVAIRSLSNSNVLLVSVYLSMKIEGAEKGVAPVQRLFCLKEKNQNKINSYHTITGSSTPLILQSNVYVLLDVGTMRM